MAEAIARQTESLVMLLTDIKFSGARINALVIAGFSALLVIASFYIVSI